jgi:anti-sigma B factor antagonist
VAFDARDFLSGPRMVMSGRGMAWMEMIIDALSDDITRVCLTGRLDIMGAQTIDLKFNAICGSRRKVIIDLSQVSFLASMGMRTILIGAKAVGANGGKIALLKPTPAVEDVLTIANINTIIPLVHDLDAAIGAVSS